MNLDEIEKCGGFVANRPIVKEITFNGFDDDGQLKEFKKTIGVRTLSYADFHALRQEYAEFELKRNAEIEAFRQSKEDDQVDPDAVEPSPPSWEMALVYAAARFGDTYKQSLSMARAHDLKHSIARPLFLAVFEENGGDKKKVNTDGRVLARNGTERHRRQDDPGSEGKPDLGGNPGLDGVLPVAGNPEPQPQT